MVVVFSLLVSLVFSFFFFAIDIWYFALIPLIFSLGVLFCNMQKLNFKFSLATDFSQYSLYLIWGLLMIGFSGVMLFLGISEYFVLLVIIGINLVLRIASFVMQYEDGKKLFEIMAYLLTLILIFSLGMRESWVLALQSFSLFMTFFFGILGFLNFIIRLRYPVEKKYSYQCLIFGIIVVMLVLVQRFPENGLGILLSFLLLTGCLIFLKTVRNRVFPKQETLNISVRRILAGERINKKITIPQWKMVLQSWINDIPQRCKYCLEFINLLLLVLVEGQYLYSLFVEDFLFAWWSYFFIVFIFLCNCYVMKRMDFVSKVSRFSWALVINFSIYFAFWSGSQDISVILPILIGWTILCKFMLLFVNKSKRNSLFNRDDYWYWTIITCIASLINIALICRLNIPGQLLFSLIVFYIGADSLILFYIFKYLKAIETEDTSEGKEKLEGENSEKGEENLEISK